MRPEAEKFEYQAGPAAGPATGGPGRSGPGRGRPAPEAQVARFAGALARAVHAFHTYPPDSPARGDVIEVARDSLRSCLSDGEECLSIDVTNEGLKVGGELVHADQGPERALALALRRTYVSTLEIRAGASTRDFRQFCALMAFPDQVIDRVEELPEILAQRGVTHIVPHVISACQTIDGGTVPRPLLEVLQQRRQAGTQPKESAEGGYIRIDPSVPLDRVTLEDLPLLMSDASSLGVALDRMARSRGSVSPSEALLLHYGQITDLYAACDPGLSDALFRRLADVVRQLPQDVRLELLKEEVLPGLVDGRRGARVLQHFSEEEIADSLWLLLDLGVGGIEMLTAGLANLDVPESRLDTIVEQVSRRLEGDEATRDDAAAWLDRLVPGEESRGDASDALEGRLTVEEAHEADFLALRGFDLSLDEEAVAIVAELVDGVARADPTIASLTCCADILSLSADPTVVTSAMRRARGLFFDLESRGDAPVLAEWLAQFAALARTRDAHDGEVAAVIRGAVDQYVTPEFIHRVSALPAPLDGEPPLVTVICELGRTGVAALVDSLAVESDRSARNRLLTALRPRAPELADHLVDYLSHPKWYVVRNIVTLLGHAGPGREEILGGLLDHRHPRVIREAFIALARLGTEEAAERTARALRHESEEVRTHAAEAIWRFDPGLSHPRLLAALGDPEFAADHPLLVDRLLHAAEARGLPGLEPVLRRLRWCCLSVWNKERRGLGWTAYRLSRTST